MLDNVNDDTPTRWDLLKAMMAAYGVLEGSHGKEVAETSIEAMLAGYIPSDGHWTEVPVRLRKEAIDRLHRLVA